MSIQIGTLESGCKKDEEYSPSEAIFYTKKKIFEKEIAVLASNIETIVKYFFWAGLGWMLGYLFLSWTLLSAHSY